MLVRGRCGTTSLRLSLNLSRQFTKPGDCNRYKFEILNTLVELRIASIARGVKDAEIEEAGREAISYPCKTPVKKTNPSNFT